MFTKRYAVNFYSLGNVITSATFLGFAKSTKEATCKHKACGFAGPFKVCKDCGKMLPKTRNYYWGKDKCPNCSGKLGPVQHPKKVTCNMERYRTLTAAELADPNREIKFALLQIVVSGKDSWFDFIIDLEARKFTKEMRTDWNHSTETYTARPTDKRSYSKLKIDKIENTEAIIDKIWESFS